MDKSTLAEDVPRLPVTAAPPVVDGCLDDACWRADAWRLPELVNTGGGVNTLPTVIHVCRDDLWLYLAFDCANPAMAQLRAVARERDSIFFGQDESVEVYADTPGMAGGHRVFGVNFINIQMDALMIQSPWKHMDWNAVWRSAVRARADGWSAELAIPLFYLAPDGVFGPELRMNFFRNATHAELDAYGAVEREARVVSSWSPRARNGWEPELFNPVAGLEKFRAAPPFLPAVEEAIVRGYRAADERAVYEVAVQLKNWAPTAGTVRLELTDMPENAPAEVVAAEVALGGGASREMLMAMPVNAPGTRQVELVVSDMAAGNMPLRITPAGTAALNIMAAPVADRNYYTTEPAALIRCEFGLPADMLAECHLAVWLAGQPLAAVERLRSRTEVAVSLAGVAEGAHTVRLELRRAAAMLAVRELSIVRRPPNTGGSEVKIDQWRRVVLRNDAPFFPFGVFTHYVTSAEEECFEYAARAGFNTIGAKSAYAYPGMGKLNPRIKFPPVDDLARWMDMAQKYDLAVVHWGAIRVHSKPLEQHRQDYQGMLPDIERAVAALRGHPNFLVYHNVDEPNLVNPEERIAMAEWYHQTVAALDPYHPLQLLYARSIPAGAKWTRWSDILLYDIYPKVEWEHFFSDVGRNMAYYTAMLKARADRDGKVVWITPLTTALSAQRTPIAMTAPQQMCQAYAAIIHGAKGLLYFTFSSIHGDEATAAFQALGRHIAAIQAAVLHDDVPQRINYTPGRMKPESLEFPMITAAFFRYPDGRHLLLAANLEDFAVAAEFEIPGLASVRELFDAGAPAKNTAGFSDRLEPYGVRAYEVEFAALPTVIGMELKMRPADPPDRAPTVRLNDRIRQLWRSKNTMPNPGFERCKTPGVPDFIFPYLMVTPEPHKTGDWRLDPDNPWEGRYSLRLRNAVLPSGMSRVAGAMGSCYPPKLFAPTEYVFSFYARAAEPGQEVTISIRDFGDQKFLLTTAWARYHFTGTFKPSVMLADKRTVYFVFPAPDATVWIDGMQLEKGDRPTAYSDDGAVLSAPADAGNLIRNGDAEYGNANDWNYLADDARGETGVTDDAHAGKHAFVLGRQRAGRAQSERFAVDAGKTTTVSGWFRTAGGATGTVNFGFTMFGGGRMVPQDAELAPVPGNQPGFRIQPLRAVNVNPVPGTRTELAAPCRAADRILLVKDGAGWQAGVPAFGDDILPNFQLAGGAITNARQAAGGWEIALSAPCGRDLPAGTPVRLHQPAANFVFDKIKVDGQWRQFKFSVAGRAAGHASDKWWPGAEQAAVYIVRGADLRDVALLFDDITVKVE